MANYPTAMDGPSTLYSPVDAFSTKPLETLKSTLRNEVGNGSVRLSLEHRGLVIELEAGAFFPSGEASLNSSAYPTVKKVAETVHLSQRTATRASLNVLPLPASGTGYPAQLGRPGG